MRASNEPENINILVFLLLSLALLAILFSASNFKLNEQREGEEKILLNIESALSGLDLKAKAVSVYNFDKNIKIYGRQDDIPLPMASLAKVMTVVLALNILGEEAVVAVGPEAIGQSGDHGLLSEERWKAKDLARLTLVASVNDGAYALFQNSGLLENEFLEKMNQKAKRIGMESTVFMNTMGTDRIISGVPEIPLGFASAYDLNILAHYALLAFPEVMSATAAAEISLTSESGFGHRFKNTNIIGEKIPGLIFSKTGFTDLAGGNLSVIFKDKEGDLVAVSVLGSTFEGRFSDMEQLVKTLYNE